MVGTRPDGPGRGQGVPWVPDLIPGAGPLSGLGALLQACETPFLLLAPCDAPRLPSDIGDRLLTRIPGVDGVMLVVEGRHQPLPALLSVELAPLITDLVKAGERRADGWLDHAAAGLIPFEDLYPDLDPRAAFHNVNTPEDLALVDPAPGR